MDTRNLGWTTVDGIGDPDSIRYLSPILTDEIDKIEKKLVENDELDQFITLDTVVRKQIVKVDYKKRNIFRWTRWVDGSGKVVSRTKEIFPISTTGVFDKEDRARTLLLGCDGVRFAYLKTKKGFVPAFAFNNGDFLQLPKDFTERLNFDPPSLKKIARRNGNRIRFKEKFSKGT